MSSNTLRLPDPGVTARDCEPMAIVTRSIDPSALHYRVIFANRQVKVDNFAQIALDMIDYREGPSEVKIAQITPRMVGLTGVPAYPYRSEFYKALPGRGFCLLPHWVMAELTAHFAPRQNARYYFATAGVPVPGGESYGLTLQQFGPPRPSLLLEAGSMKYDSQFSPDINFLVGIKS